MAPLTLEGDTLGEKRRHFNKLVEDAVANEHYQLRNISADDSDIENLLKIEIACKTRNVDYIIEVMKSKDMLYAATAIKKSTWLITEQQYAHIINPEYLHTQLLPNMNTKTFNKLMLHIRLNLKDETRVETFYEYLKQSDSAYKWLEHCSIPFIENVIKNERLIPLSLFKRLCTRSAHFLKYHKRVVEWDIFQFNHKMLFLVKSHADQYFNFLEEQEPLYMGRIGKKRTSILMKKYAQIIFEKFQKYKGMVEASVAAKYLNKNDIKPFLFKQIKTPGYWYFIHFGTLGPFVKNMLEEERLEFIRQTFIDRTDRTYLRSENKMEEYKTDAQFYEWYEFFPFNVAYPELQKLLLAENSPFERCAMLGVLIKCARKNPQHIKTLLQFFKDRHVNEPFNFKIQFINNLLSQVSTHEFDIETWNILDQLFHSMEVYTESENNVQQCLQAIFLYKVLHDEPVPEIVERTMKFDTFEKLRRILNQEQNDKIFSYLLNAEMEKIRKKNFANESVFDLNSLHLKNGLTLLKVWKKDISRYPLLIEKIQELVTIKHENSWKIYPELYNMNKSWRKHMFEESLLLCLSEETCLNALKHKPQLLTRHDKQIDTLRTDDAVSLPRLLAKLRVYWPHSLAQHWTEAYLLNLNKPTGQKAVIKGLFALLPQNQIIGLAERHAPSNYKINWGETDQTEIIVGKNIAKHLHLARPVIPLETVLCYAKGDYLQFAMPSLYGIMSKLTKAEIHKHVLKLLEAPVSLKKLGLQLAISNLKPSEMKTSLLDIWNSTRNSVIRAVIFKNIYHRLCEVNNTTVEKELWALLSALFDTLSNRENKIKLNKCLFEVHRVPLSVRGKFYMKSFTYLSSLPQNVTRDKLVSDLILFVRDNLDIIDSFDVEFVANILLSPAGTKFCIRDSDYIDIFGRFVLWGKTEEDQLLRFRKVIAPAMEEAFVSWRKAHQDEYYVKYNFDKFLRYLAENFKNFTLSRKTTPTKLFIEIKNKMEKSLELLENYVPYTGWKLVTEYAQVVEQHTSEMGDTWLTGENEKLWDEIHVAMYPALASQILKCLKEDIEQYYPSIYLMFADALNDAFFYKFRGDSDQKLEILKHMLKDPDFTPSFIVVSRAQIRYSMPESSSKLLNEILKKLKSHPSQEVQMHYYHAFE